MDITPGPRRPGRAAAAAGAAALSAAAAAEARVVRSKAEAPALAREPLNAELRVIQVRHRDEGAANQAGPARQGAEPVLEGPGPLAQGDPSRRANCAPVRAASRTARPPPCTRTRVFRKLKPACACRSTTTWLAGSIQRSRSHHSPLNPQSLNPRRRNKRPRRGLAARPSALPSIRKAAQQRDSSDLKATSAQFADALARPGPWSVGRNVDMLAKFWGAVPAENKTLRRQ